MPLSEILPLIAQRYQRVRSGLDVGFDDEGLTNQLREFRDGVWMSISAKNDFPFEDSQFEVVVANGALLTREIVREINRVMKSEGCLFFTVNEKTSRQPGLTLPQVYKMVREGFDIVTVKRPSWWFFRRRGRTLTICARKKNWRQHHGFIRNGGMVLSPLGKAPR